MKPQDLPVGTAVRIDWVDSASQDGWTHPDADLAPGEVSSIGFVFRVGLTGISITTSLHKEVGGGVDPITIPWVAITALHPLGECYDAGA